MEIHDYLAGRQLTQGELTGLCQEWGLADVAACLACCPGAQVLPALAGPPWRCQRCGNQDPQAFWTFQGLAGEPLTYCLDCLGMGRVMSDSTLYRWPATSGPRLSQSPLTWTGQLTPQQDQVAQRLLAAWQSPTRQPQLVWAVTGAGKTELMFPVMAAALRDGGRVAMASPRVDVCLEVAPRLRTAFAGMDSQLLYGGSEDRYVQCPLTVATTHQLLRCYQAFDLLVVDEVDAFPYVDSRLLHTAVAQALKPRGLCIYLTATPDDALLAAVAAGQVACQRLPARYHGYPLPRPQLTWVGDWATCLNRGRLSWRLRRLLRQFAALPGAKLLFVPHIAQGQACARLLQALVPNLRLAAVHASDPQRHANIQRLRQGDLDCLVTTTILERGVTLTNCQVCILGAEDALYSRASLVQMSGRAGRSAAYPTGAVWWAHQGQSRAMRQALAQIDALNQEAAQRGLLTVTDSQEATQPGLLRLHPEQGGGDR